MSDVVRTGVFAVKAQFVSREFAPETLRGREELQVNRNAAEKNESDQEAENCQTKVALSTGVILVAAHQECHVRVIVVFRILSFRPGCC